jgi:xeroderma pigmentosum group C-complementing protein
VSAETEEDEDIPEVYREMLAEAENKAQGHKQREDRPLKRRRVGERAPVKQDDRHNLNEDKEPIALVDTPSELVQTAIDSGISDDSDISDESDVEWEEVDIEPQLFAQAQSSDHEDKDEPLQITLDQGLDTPKKATVTRRKPMSAAEKKFRLDIHKFHLLCLLGHVQARNHWCNDQELQVSDTHGQLASYRS